MHVAADTARASDLQHIDAGSGENEDAGLKKAERRVGAVGLADVARFDALQV